MTITATAIKIGTSVGVTLPAKELKNLGIKPGDKLEISFKPIESNANTHSAEIVAITQKLIERHQKALDNLSQR